ncbi:TniQ family protein [Kibdelosporangium aridum]|uniref:TniQ family protein n=1 Tax=Kibdelosporangium aridum TaxID=2030 RepID=UPI0035E88DF1
MTEVRVLPVRLPPLAGEALDSWLEAIAHRLDTHLNDLLSAVGLSERDENRSGWGHLPIRLRSGELAAVAAATGVPAAQIKAMTLACYDGTALRLNTRNDRVSRHHLWGRGRGSRFCPDCLGETGGRWPLVWRLGWCFACLRHQRLLADACPQCGRVQRQRPHPVHVVPALRGTVPARQLAGPGWPPSAAAPILRSLTPLGYMRITPRCPRNGTCWTPSNQVSPPSASTARSLNRPPSHSATSVRWPTGHSATPPPTSSPLSSQQTRTL